MCLNTLQQAYKAVNQQFADAIQDIYRDGDMVRLHQLVLCVLLQLRRHSILLNLNSSVLERMSCIRNRSSHQLLLLLLLRVLLNACTNCFC
jgi:hypothetical protein